MDKFPTLITKDFIKKVIWYTSKSIYRFMPLPITTKQKLIQKFFLRFGRLLNMFIGYGNGYHDVPINRVKINEHLTRKIRYVPFVENKPIKDAPVKILAFYLPQFHANPENDAWWGEDFTEWTNVKPAQPQFKGHYQPYIPGELGYYNLLDIKTQQRQVELAKNYGIGGFCFHFYWFNGKRLLEKPIENYLLNPQLDLSFCISWANENWTRRWDGMENEILIRQHHSPDDDLAFIRYVSNYMLDKRYIRINNKPLLIVYRPGLLPSAKETAGRWRNWCKVHGIGEIYLAYVQSFEKINPDEYGYDAAVEFPPNIFYPSIVTHLVRPLNRNFRCNVYDWKSMVKSSEHYSVPDYKLFRGVCPSWDNTPRRENESAIFINNHPDDFKEWVYNASVDTCKRFENPDERLVFVNAWNEWAEGAYLEPDQKYGYAWLEALRNGLLLAKKEIEAHKIILVSHDAHPFGAQINALEMTRTLIRDLKINVEVILLGDGILKDSFEALTRVHDLSNININDTKVIELVRSLARRGYKKAIVNTTVSGKLIPVLFREGIDCISLVHELPGIIKSYNLENSIKDIASFANKIVFAAKVVEDGFKQFSDVDTDRLVIQPQGLYRRNKWRFDKESARALLRDELLIERSTKIVLSVGYADHRKGVDLFVDMGLQILLTQTDVVFIWVGNIEQSMQNVIGLKLDNNPLKKFFYFVGFKSDTGIYYAASDVFALTAREDPFPSVVMESFDVGLPVVAFEGSGGAATLVDQVGGVAVPADDVKKFAEVVNSLIDDHILNNELGMNGQEYLDKNFSFRKYMFFLCEMFNIKLPRVSVIVPNYNYANYIIERLNSIMNQSMPIYELIILDDASTDNSKQNILKWLQENNVEIKLIINEFNSGAVIHQWKKGLEYTTGDFVWIAEADDLSEPDFLETVLPSLMINDVVLSYCESKQVDSAGKIVANNYHDYLKDVSSERWSNDYTGEGIEEIKSSLAVLNTIPNVSAVLFRRDVLTRVFNDYFEEFLKYKRAGDYIVYVRLLSAGKIAFSINNANLHRRHGNSVIAESDSMKLYSEIERIQKIVANDFTINESTLRLAERYLSLLRKQFNLIS